MLPTNWRQKFVTACFKHPVTGHCETFAKKELFWSKIFRKAFSKFRCVSVSWSRVGVAHLGGSQYEKRK